MHQYDVAARAEPASPVRLRSQVLDQEEILKTGATLHVSNHF